MTAFVPTSADAQQKTTPRTSPPAAALPAATPPPAEPEVTVKAKHGAWVIRCQKFQIPANLAAAQPDAKKGARGDRVAANAKPKEINRCETLQLMRGANNKRVGMRVSFTNVTGPNKKQIKLMRMVVPIGVYLGDGIGLQLDGKAQRFSYTKCYPQFCTSNVPVSPDLLKALQKGKAATFFVYAAPGKSINFKMDLNGFTAALKDL